MANAFQDQLLKAGLVSKDKLVKSNKAKYKKAKQQPKNKNTETDKIKEQVKLTSLEKAEHDRELNRKKVEEINKNAIAGQIRQLVEMNRIHIRLEEDDDEVVYNFEDDSKVKRIYVTEDLRKQILNGQLAIVRLAEEYVLVPKVVADKIMQRDAHCVVLCNDSVQSNDEDDEYADYKVPDDLMW